MAMHMSLPFCCRRAVQVAAARPILSTSTAISAGPFAGGRR